MKSTVTSCILDATDLNPIVDILVELSATKKIFTFTGTLGAGKTTLVQTFARRLGVVEAISSPTYTYLNIYKTSKVTLYHFDLYRLHSYHDFVEAGFEEYLSTPGGICLIEWPEIVLSYLDKDKVCSVTIDYYGEKRCYTLYY